MDSLRVLSRCRSLGLYALTLIVEIPVVFVRVMLCYLTALIVLMLSGHDTVAASDWAWIGVLPTVWSLSAFIPHNRDGVLVVVLVWLAIVNTIVTGNPIGYGYAVSLWALAVYAQPWTSGWWWQTRSGGRPPSAREADAYQEAITDLQESAAAALPLPTRWFVIDDNGMGACVNGQTLMLSRDMLSSPYLPAVLAHELGHLASNDGRLTAALNRLIVQPISGERLRFWRGGLALRILQPIWAIHWRSCEHAADEYAHTLGQGHDLAQFLEEYALQYDRPAPFLWLTDQTHPSTEHRIDRLQALENPDVPPPPNDSPSGFLASLLRERSPRLG